MLYLRWESDQGPIIRLVESKARLTWIKKVMQSKQRYVEQWFHLV